MSSIYTELLYPDVPSLYASLPLPRAQTDPGHVPSKTSNPTPRRCLEAAFFASSINDLSTRPRIQQSTPCPVFPQLYLPPDLPCAPCPPQALPVVLILRPRRMQFTTLVSLTIVFVQIGITMASPAAQLQSRAECPMMCVNDAECVDCPFDVKYTCITAGVPGSEGVRLFAFSRRGVRLTTSVGSSVSRRRPALPGAVPRPLPQRAAALASCARTTRRVRHNVSPPSRSGVQNFIRHVQNTLREGKGSARYGRRGVHQRSNC